MSKEEMPLKHESVETKDFSELSGEIVARDISAIEKLRYTNRDIEKVFLADDSIVRPDFVYGNLNRDEIFDNLEAIQNLSDEVKKANLSRSEELAANALIDNAAKRNVLVESCAGYNAAEDAETKAKYAELCRLANESLYGTPDENTFYSLLNEALGRIDESGLEPEDKAIYDSLMNELGEIKPTAVERFKPKEETVKRFSEMVGVLFEGFWEHIPEGKDKFSTQDACDITNEILREEIGADATDYRAVMSNKSKSVSVNHEKREIIFPVERAKGDFNRESLKQILSHELGTHVFRAMVYEKHDIPALSRELPGNSEIDEGIAKCCEQAIAGKYSDSGVDHYINIGLATFKGKNFREVFSIQQKLNYLKDVKPGETAEEKAARMHAKDSDLFTRTVRCFRGTGELPNNKDLVYYKGAERVWRYIEENIDNPDLMDNLFLSGKSNIFDINQQRLIYETKVS